MIIKAQLTAPKKISIAFSYIIFALSVWSSPAIAGDPFRTSNSRDIPDQTEAAFEALFQQGNYQESKRYLIEAESSGEKEPLTYAMRASLAYTEQDWNTLNTYASKTLEIAKKLKSEDPLRSNLYTAVGHFLEGTYKFEKEGPLAAITKLQQVFQYLDAAEKNDADDPELNLIKGYMDLMLAVNLPFSSPEQAIARFSDYAAPTYLVNRGLALAYRDLNKYDKALPFVEQALIDTPDNPELYYLKGQILYKQGKSQQNNSLFKQALENFDKALEKADQLPNYLVKALRHERQVAIEKMNGISP